MRICQISIENEQIMKIICSVRRLQIQEQRKRGGAAAQRAAGGPSEGRRTSCHPDRIFAPTASLLHEIRDLLNCIRARLGMKPERD